MTRDGLKTYKAAQAPLPATMWLWPLYGAGFENLGVDGKPIQAPVPSYGPDELLVRHDAVGLCFSDVKVIRAGDQHPRLQGRDMKAKPVVLGHEVALTIVGVGENLKGKFKVGERYIIQADIYVGGKTFAYGYVLQGGLSQYNVLGEEALNGDEGCYLLPIHKDLSYASVALTEPWACVEAVYHIPYRTTWQEDGVVWFIGTAQSKSAYTLGQPWAAGQKPRLIIATDVPAALLGTLKAQAAQWSIPLKEMNQLSEATYGEVKAATEGEGVNDIIILGADADITEKAMTLMAVRGTLNLVAEQPMQRAVQVDVGRVHYDWLQLMGAQGTDISKGYAPIRTEVKPGGKAWFVGAAGPMGRMLVQYTLESAGKPAVAVAHDLVTWRLDDLNEKLAPIAEANSVNLIALSQEGMAAEAFHARLNEIAPQGFDDIVVPAPTPRAVEGAMAHLAENCTVCIFAGLSRGTMATLDLTPVYRRGVRFTGSSGSSILDMQRTLERAESGHLFPEQVVAAVASLGGAKDGLDAVATGRFSGKVVIYPQIADLPVTPLDKLGERLPKVAKLLSKSGAWTKAAEEELLREMLPQD